MRSVVVCLGALCSAAGVAVFLIWPSDWAFWVGLMLFLAPLFAVSVALDEYPAKDLRRRLPAASSKPLWTVCIALAVGGTLVHLLWMNDRTWGVGLLAVLPLAVLILYWIEQERNRTGKGPEGAGPDLGGPLGPPMA